MVLLAIDPGREKCGLAVVADGALRLRRIVPAAALADAVGEIVAGHGVTRVVVGGRTGAAEVVRLLAGRWPALAVTIVPEEGTTLEARRRYFRDHPPAGWRRILPLSMQVPPEPYDDYAAVVIAERYLKDRVRTSKIANERA